jgi:hypothetical protein
MKNVNYRQLDFKIIRNWKFYYTTDNAFDEKVFGFCEKIKVPYKCKNYNNFINFVLSQENIKSHGFMSITDEELMELKLKRILDL